MCNTLKQKDQLLLKATNLNPNDGDDDESATTNESKIQEAHSTITTLGKRKRDLPIILTFDEFNQQKKLVARRSMGEQVGPGNKIVFNVRDIKSFVGTNKERKQKVRDWVIDFNNINGLMEYVNFSEASHVSVEKSATSVISSEASIDHPNGLDAKKAVYEYVGRLLMPFYRLKKLSKDNFKYIYKTTVEKVMEHNNGLDFVVNVTSGFLDTQSKVKIQSFVHKLINTFKEEEKHQFP